MDVLPINEQDRLVKATETAIQHTKEGLTPNQAIEKVALQEGYTPEFISRIVQGFNKAKSVHRMKEASSSTRHEPFSLADVNTIVNSIYTPVAKEASLSFNLPSNLSNADAPVAPVEKTARIKEQDAFLQKISHIRNPELTAASYTGALQSQADFFGKLEKIASAEIGDHRNRFMRSLETICDYCRPMTDKELQKTARMAVNGYPGIGDKMMNIIAYKTQRKIPAEALQKTASGHIFPAKEPFLSMQTAYDSARSLAEGEIWHKHVQKEAAVGSSMLKGFMTGAAANKLIPQGNADAGAAAGSTEDLSPDYFNKIKALDAKRALYDMMLNDDKFKGYKHNQMVGAWNSLAKSHPKIMNDNPAAASTLMLQQLETGGRRDLHEIEQAQKVEKATEPTY